MLEKQRSVPVFYPESHWLKHQRLLASPQTPKHKLSKTSQKKTCSLARISAKDERRTTKSDAPEFRTKSSTMLCCRQKLHGFVHLAGANAANGRSGNDELIIFINTEQGDVTTYQSKWCVSMFSCGCAAPWMVVFPFSIHERQSSVHVERNAFHRM